MFHLAGLLFLFWLEYFLGSMYSSLSVSSMADAQNFRNKRRLVGAIAIVLITVFFLLTFVGIINLWIMLVADLIVWAVSNLILRRMGKTSL